MSSRKDSKYIFFWLPYDVKYTHKTFLTSLYLALDRFPIKNSIHIGQKKIFEPPSADIPENWLASYDANIPTEDLLASIDKILIDPKVFDELEKKYKSKNIVWGKLLTERYLPLEPLLSDIFNDLASKYDISAIVLWCNIPSVTYVAEQMKIKVIHNEMGPLRSPSYVGTCYFDFSGVNGNTEASKRFTSFSKEKDFNETEQFERNYLLNLLRIEKREKDTAVGEIYDIGVPLQVEDDSNIIAFSKGFSNLELITYCRSLSNNVLIRKHPYGYVNYSEITPNSDMLTPQEFIEKCRSIVTINSSVSLESILYGKKTTILGDSPFNLLNEGMDEESIGKFLDFIVLNYLIPLEFLYNKNYYDWRLSNPSEKEIRNYHLNYYLEKLMERTMLFHEIRTEFTELTSKLNDLNKEILDLSNQIYEIKSELEYYKRDNSRLCEEINSIKMGKGISSVIVKPIKYFINLAKNKKTKE
ncbi:GT99 family glycosyltransferase N-terminal domain-containing protein [Yersinia enterocolitica]|uniref:GT99 family glycosyltransferase N-terminal domain-containing protein n=1 Tax=Yersinia TaxID=629 RepID=UPI003AB6C0CD